MGMCEDDFWHTTMVYFQRRRRAWLHNRPLMEAARFGAFYALKAAGIKIRRYEQVVRFPWDVVVRRVQLEDWNSPAMLRFSEEADRALAVLNPEAYAKYMEGKRLREQAATTPPDPDFEINMDIEL